MDRHLILTSGRSGSNNIANLLNQHPNIVNYGEVLGEWTFPYRVHRQLQKIGYDWPKFLDLIYDKKIPYYGGQLISSIKHIKQKKPINFKLRSQIQTIGIKDFSFLIYKRNLVNYLLENNEIKIIHLRRINLLKRFLSVEKMQISGIVKLEKEQSTKNLFEVNVDRMKAQLQIYKQEENEQLKLVELLGTDRVYNINYEEYFYSRVKMAEVNRDILRFLGVPIKELKSSHQKIAEDNLENEISNFKQVSDALSGTEFEKYLSS